MPKLGFREYAVIGLVAAGIGLFIPSTDGSADNLTEQIANLPFTLSSASAKSSSGENSLTNEDAIIPVQGELQLSYNAKTSLAPSGYHSDGVDMSTGGESRPIYAATGGIVLPGTGYYGNEVKIESVMADGKTCIWTYGHTVAGPIVPVGQPVEQGQHIADTGKSGFTDGGIHLHLAAICDGVNTDPAKYIKDLQGLVSSQKTNIRYPLSPPNWVLNGEPNPNPKTNNQTANQELPQAKTGNETNNDVYPKCWAWDQNTTNTYKIVEDEANCIEKEYKGIMLVGPKKFIENTMKAIDIAEDTEEFKQVRPHIRYIFNNKPSGGITMEPNKYNAFGLSSDYWENDNTLSYSSFIVHEGYHLYDIAKQQMNNQGGKYAQNIKQMETDALLFQAKYLEKMGGDKSLIDYCKSLSINPTYQEGGWGGHTY